MNTTLGPGGPLVLTGSFAVANLGTMKTNLQTAITAVEGPRNDRQNAGTDRDFKKDPLLERLRQFRGVVIGQLAGSVYAGSAPTIPSFAVSEGVFMRAMDDMQSLWVKINAAAPPGFPVPLVLSGGYTAANHLTDVTALRATYATYNSAAQTVGLRLGDRDVLLPPIRQRLVQYRTVIQGIFPKGHALILSLPRVTPLPGSTPKPAVLSFDWNETTDMADFSWTLSPSPGITQQELRACDPPTYRTSEEDVVESLEPTVTSTSSNFGLGISGATKLFRLYSMTGDGNEKGSNTVKVIRP